MKSLFSSRRIIITIFLILSVVLVACERQINPEEEVPNEEVPVLTPPVTAPTVDPALIPTTDPALIPTTDPALLPTVDPAAPPAQGTDPNAQLTPAAASPVTHVVNAGETLFSIALQYGITVEELAAANNINQTDVLTPGQSLTVPVAGTTTVVDPTVEAPTTTTTGEQVHIVQAGENLYRIGLRYGFTVEQLATYNNIANPDRISVGQQILIPPG